MSDRNVDIVQPSRNAVVYLPDDGIDLTGYPIKDAWHDEGFNNSLEDSDPTIGWTNMQFWTGTIGQVTAEWRFPTRFKAIHCSLIPKGPHRGRLLLWDGLPVIASSDETGPGLWSWQSIVILDLSPNATIRCRNYLLPIEPVQVTAGLDLYESFFCAGHCWTEFGDLVIAGGNLWTTLGEPPAFTAFSYQGLWTWNPDHPAAIALPNNGLTSFTYKPMTNGHYADFGAWVPYGLMQAARWYPTVKTTPRYAFAPYNGRSGVLVFGGNVNPNNAAGSDTSWRHYEAYIVDHSPVCTELEMDSGLILDSRDPTGLFDGPEMDPSDAKGYEGTFIFYPHMFQLSNGTFYMSGMAAIPATLTNFETNTWTQSPGGTPSGAWQKERMYASSVLAPNHDGVDDRVIIVGGGNYYVDPLNPLAIRTSTDTAKIIDASDPVADWTYLPNLNYRTTEQNLTVTPDADIYLFGGVYREYNPATQELIADLHTKAQRLSADPTSPTGFAAQWDLIYWSPAESYRDYHSTTMLLPDGRIFTGGGDQSEIPIDPSSPSHAHNPTASDHPGYDYEIFNPRYIRPTSVPAITFPRPKNVAIVGETPVSGTYALSYNTSYTVSCDALTQFRTLSHVVLMAPGSKTHHIDYSELYYKPHTQSVASPTTITFTVPASDNVIPRGYYMLFVLDDNRVPSEAIWIKL